MKTNQIIKTVLFVSIFSLTAFANAGTPPQAKKEVNTAKTVQRYFKFPSLLLNPVSSAKSEEIEKVEVLFTTDATGKVNFVVAKTANQALKSEIEKQFYTMPFKQGSEDVVHRVILNFRIA